MDLPALTAFASAFVALVLATIALIHGRTLAHWLFALGMAVLAAEGVLYGLAADALIPTDIVHWQNWRLAVTSLLPGTWVCFSLVYARGNYREFLSRWKVILAIVFITPLALTTLFHGRLIGPLENTPPDHPLFGFGLPGFILYLVILVSCVLILMNLERTYRAAVGTMAWRIKFMMIGLGIFFGVRAYSSSQVLLFHAVNPSFQTLNSIALIVAGALILRSLFRPGHFEVSVYPAYEILQNSVTVILAGVYLIIVGILARVVTFLGGDASFTLKAFLVLLALVVVTMLVLSDRVRLQTRTFVSRYFQRPMYDYRSVWRTFTEGTARQVEQTDLCEQVVKLTSQVFQALSVTIWIVDPSKPNLTFVASSSLSKGRSEQQPLDTADASAIIKNFTEIREPVDIDASRETWASLLRRLHPDEFRKGGNRIAVPMFTGGELLGIMIVGDRVSGLPFTTQDFDLLKSIGDQVAASLLNIRLSQRLAQGKQLEAFQAMSAFFVHDLKNTASTLSLMLKNLPIHFNDPRFREDALRGISKTVTHINDIIARLGTLRQEIALKPAEADLNSVVEESLKCLVDVPRITVSKTLAPLPKIQFDAFQIQNVVTNLLLNARDAIQSNGEIRIETLQRNGSVLLSISDTGCGMTPDFIQRSLFRPFQTTKNKGIGIGMFQCKMIIEAHRGQIEVESNPGQGTNFKVLLPIT